MNLVMLAFGSALGLLAAETRLSWRHEAALRARGAIEPPGDPYLWLAVAYPLAFLLMGAEGMYRAATGPGPAGTPQISWPAAGLLLFVAAKMLKYWAIGSLGDRWTFRVLVLPGLPLVSTGPYQYVAHPNYVAVIGELVGFAMMMEATIAGPVMTTVFVLVLARRIRVESAALKLT